MVFRTNVFCDDSNLGINLRPRFRVLPSLFIAAFLLMSVKFFDLTFLDKISDKWLSVIAAAEETQHPATPEGEQAQDNTNNTTWNPGGQSDQPVKIEPSDISEMEKTILENLAKRRQELEQWSQSILMKENLLSATEKKVDRKMEELRKLQSQVEILLEEYNKRENQKILRLVKIYENMKPKKAAKIFETMELPILLEVLGQMKEANAAPILANMDYVKANEVTENLAKQHRLPSP